MKAIKIYLAGRCKGLEDEGASWRQKITEMLKFCASMTGTRVKIFDPTKFFSYKEEKHKTQKQIKHYYFHRLRECDVVIVNCNDTNFSIGTAQEIQFAVDNNIPVVGFGTTEMYPWITEVDCQVVFDSIHECVDYIRDYYLVEGYDINEETAD